MSHDRPIEDRLSLKEVRQIVATNTNQAKIILGLHDLLDDARGTLAVYALEHPEDKETRNLVDRIATVVGRPVVPWPDIAQ